jgi:hypothetical protein
MEVIDSVGIRSRVKPVVDYATRAMMQKLICHARSPRVSACVHSASAPLPPFVGDLQYAPDDIDRPLTQLPSAQRDDAE